MAKQCDDSPEVPYKPSPEIEALLKQPKRYLIVVDEDLANESCPLPTHLLDEEGKGHRFGNVKIHPYKYPEEYPPLGFIVMPSMQHVDVLKEKYPELCEYLKEVKKIEMFPYNGP